MQQQEQIIYTGNILEYSIFEQKLLRNFAIINNKLKRLQNQNDFEMKFNNINKEIKFINNKVDTINDKIKKDKIKDYQSINKNQIKNIVQEQIICICNSKQNILQQTKSFQQINQHIEELWNTQLKLAANNGLKIQKQKKGKQSIKQSKNIQDFQQSGKEQSVNTETNKTTLNASQLLFNNATLKQKQHRKSINKQSLEQCLDKNQMDIVNGIIKEDHYQDEIISINSKIDDLYLKLEEIKFSRGVSSYIQKEVERFDKYEQYEQQTARKHKNKGGKVKKESIKGQSIKLQNIKGDNIKGENSKGDIIKKELYTEQQKAQMIKEQMGKQQAMKQNTQNKWRMSGKGEDGHIEEGKQRTRRAKSMKKLQRVQRRLKVDEFKDVNGVLKEIQIRLQGKVPHQTFMSFVQDLQQKIEILRITKDCTYDLNQLRKQMYQLDNKVISIATYLQSISNEDDALLVKKQWSCISCDKSIDKYAGKVGQHLSWDQMNGKKMSPTKAGAFGQTGQLASKVKNLMEGKIIQ